MRHAHTIVTPKTGSATNCLWQYRPSFDEPVTDQIPGGSVRRDVRSVLKAVLPQ